MIDASDISAFMTFARMKQQALADELGVGQSTVSRWLKGTRPDPEQQDALEALFRRHNFQPGQPAAAPRAGYTAPPQFFDGNDLPVFAAVEGGPGEMVVNSDPIDYVVRPWFLRNIKEGYAVIVSGESMVPLFEPGDMVLVNPRLPVVPGKAAIFVEGEERGEFNATVKRFVKSEPDIWRARQFNPEKELALPKSRWRKALRIVGKYDGY